MEKITRNSLLAVLFFVFLSVSGMAFAAQSFTGELTNADNSFDRNNCNNSGSYRYDEYLIYHSGGLLTIDMERVSMSDPYLLLYTPPFDPSLPCDNQIEGNDDGGVGLNARIVTTQPAGNYVIVATSFSSSDRGTYLLSVNRKDIPTLSEWGMILLGLLMAAVAAGVMRHERRV